MSYSLYCSYRIYDLFCLTRQKNYDGCLEKVIYIYEKNLSGNKIGYGEVVVVLNNEWKIVDINISNKPFVWFTSTELWRLMQWFGLMRLLHLNELSKNMLWYKLYSSIDLMDWTWAKRNREKLIELWKAEEDLSYTTFKRYRFI